tara:strand:+ start:1115 stop:1447 length:333 start_codon:yes stop_codon:yes gene_type:complete
MKLETFKWLYQRISTPLILVLFFWFIYNAYQIQNYNYETITAFFRNDLNLFFFIIFIFLSLFHTAIEVFHCIEDYFTQTNNEKIIRYLITILYTIMLLSILFFLIKFINS